MCFATQVVMNLPSLLGQPTSYMENTEILLNGLEKVMMVRGTHKEVVTAYV